MTTEEDIRERAEGFDEELKRQFAPIKPWAVLGSGPAGLLAAHALGIMGQPVAVFSKPQKSVIGGAQFLHRPIPMLTSTEPDFQITYLVHGDSSLYRAKVYGDKPEQYVPFVSMDGVKDQERQDAWSLTGIYDKLWQAFGNNVEQNAVENITPEWLDEHVNDFRGIVSTIPAAALCRDKEHHRFIHQNVKLIHGNPGLGEDVVSYCGCRDHRWYRASNIQGVGWREYGDGPVVPLDEDDQMVNVRKPLWTNCDCNPGVVRAGRMGTWTKGVLVHDAFDTAWRALAS